MKKATKNALGVGAGVLTAAAVAGAAAYLLADNPAVKKGKAKAKAWVEQAKKEVVKNAKVARKLGAKEYAYLVDQAVMRYGSLKDASGPEILAAAKELKGEWDRIQKQAMKMSSKKKTAPKAKKTVRKGAKRKTAKRSK